MNEDLYSILGVNRKATTEEIKKAYKKKAIETHPDKGGDEELFKKVSNAYNILSDQNKKNNYDRYGDPNGRPTQTQYGNPFDFFRTRPKPKGKNIILKLDLTLEECLNGTKKEVSFTKITVCGTCEGSGGEEPIVCNQCNGNGFIHHGNGVLSMCGNCSGKGYLFKKICKNCGGRGRFEKEHKIKITIPRGVRNDKNLILHNIGNEVPGGVSGDVVCFLNILEHDEFKLNGLDLFKNLEVGFLDMILGKEIEFNTLDGRVKLTVPKLCQSNKVFRLKSKGMYNENNGRGDMFITIIPKLPEDISNDELLLLEQLKTSPNFN